MCSKNRIGSKTVPCGTPESTVTRTDYIPSQGRMQDFSGGGPTLKFVGFWIYIVASSELAPSLCSGGLGACSPNKIFKNSAILCVLRAIFNHFHGKKSSKKIIYKHEFFY